MNETLTPKAIVAALDAHIIGQQDAKKAVAVALRNRWRRQQLAPELRDEVTPKNILMIGPTGCGKTEISRRLAKLADAPFVKVEATKFTESAMSAATSSRSRAIWSKKRSGSRRSAAAPRSRTRPRNRRWAPARRAHRQGFVHRHARGLPPAFRRGNARRQGDRDRVEQAQQMPFEIPAAARR